LLLLLLLLPHPLRKTTWLLPVLKTKKEHCC